MLSLSTVCSNLHENNCSRQRQARILVACRVNIPLRRKSHLADHASEITSLRFDHTNFLNGNFTPSSNAIIQPPLANQSLVQETLQAHYQHHPNAATRPTLHHQLDRRRWGRSCLLRCMTYRYATVDMCSNKYYTAELIEIHLFSRSSPRNTCSYRSFAVATTILPPAVWTTAHILPSISTANSPGGYA